MTIIEQIKAEIEKLIERYSSVKAKGVLQEGYKGGRLIGYEDVLNILERIQEESEKPINQDGLEKEINRFRTIFKNECDPRIIGEVENHFAQWGAEHRADERKTSPKDLEEAAEAEEDRVIEEVEKDDRGCPYISSTHVYNAFVRGAKWDRSQMMKEAVEGEVTYDSLGYNNVIRAGVFNTDFEYGDKVKIIIIKED